MNDFTKRKYDSGEVQSRLCDLWDTSGLYNWQGGSGFIIDTPPPTVSGTLHIGHVFSYIHVDIIARYKRMKGYDVFYPMGFDDNGLPTEKLVEKTIKMKSASMPRGSLVDLCNKIAYAEQEKYKNVFKTMGLSVDWRYQYRTVSNDVKRLSQMSFIDLYNKGHVYRTKTPVIWDVVQQTAIAQAEIEDVRVQSVMNYIIFKDDRGAQLIIATTRPELLPACAAVFFNPEDDRYKHLKGGAAYSPVFGVKVPILEDKQVKPEKGTGLVMCCTFGDELDLFWWKQHNLPLNIVLTKNGKISLSEVECDENTKGCLHGKSILEARKGMINILTEQGLIVKQESVTQDLRCSERSSAPIEILPTSQWFIAILKHKDMLMQATEGISWHPRSMKRKLLSWIEALSWDWCISRQRSFGVPIPVWYSKRQGEEGKVIMPSCSNCLPVDPVNMRPEGYAPEEVYPDMDVLDTWATSSLTPQISARMISDEYKLDPCYSNLYPAHLRPQSHEIIRTWAFYTIIKSLLHAGKLPWRDVMISGWCLADNKDKMSKSKGNIISADKLLKNHSADAVRYWAASAKLGSDTVYCDNTLRMGKRLVTKLWNVSKFVNTFLDCSTQEKISFVTDKWIMGKLQGICVLYEKAFDKYEYSDAKEHIERFFWDIYCDNYIELIKSRTYNKDYIGHKSACVALTLSLKMILKMLAPFIPFVTDEVCRALYKESVHRKYDHSNINFRYYEVGDQVVSILKQVREFKSERQISIKQNVDYIKIEYQHPELLEMSLDIESACNADKVEWISSDNAHEGPKVIILDKDIEG